MRSAPNWKASDPLVEAEILYSIYEELERLTAEALERARAAVERADHKPLLEIMKGRLP